MNTISEQLIIEEIDKAFPPVDMPVRQKLYCSDGQLRDPDQLEEDLDCFRRKLVNRELFYWVHDELILLSPETWRWLIPNYVKFCLTREGYYNEFPEQPANALIWVLGCESAESTQLELRLAFFNKGQLGCLLKFVDWWTKSELNIDRNDRIMTVVARSRNNLSAIINGRDKK
jgi:hypothetical protein